MVEKANLAQRTLAIVGSVWGAVDYMNGDLRGVGVMTAIVAVDAGILAYRKRNKENKIPPTEIVYLSPDESRKKQEILRKQLEDDALRQRGKVFSLSSGQDVWVPPIHEGIKPKKVN